MEHFLMLCELKCGTTGKAISKMLMESLHMLGFTDNVLRTRILGFCTDGASNLHGCVKGEIQLFSQHLNRNDIITFHCMNHKLELAVHDAVSSTNRMSYLR